MFDFEEAVCKRHMVTYLEYFVLSPASRCLERIVVLLETGSVLSDRCKMLGAPSPGDPIKRKPARI